MLKFVKPNQSKITQIILSIQEALVFEKYNDFKVIKYFVYSLDLCSFVFLTIFNLELLKLGVSSWNMEFVKERRKIDYIASAFSGLNPFCGNF